MLPDRNDVIFIAGPGIKELYAEATAGLGEAPAELKAMSAAVVLGLHLPGDRVVLGETLNDIVDASKDLPASCRYKVQIQFFFLRMLRGEDGKKFADSIFTLFRNNLVRSGVRTLPENFDAGFVEHTSYPINPVLKLVINFETERKDDVFKFIGAIETAHNGDPNYALKARLTREMELRTLRGAKSPGA